jgi:hypothetical protein
MIINFDTASANKRDGQALIALLSVLYGQTESNQVSIAPQAPTPTLQTAIDSTTEAAAEPSHLAIVGAGMKLTEDAPTSATETTTRKRRTKAEMAADAAAAQADRPPTTGDQLMAAEAARKAAAEAAQSPTTTTTTQAVNGSAKLSADELRALLNGYIARHSMEEAIEKLRAFGCNRVTEALALESAKLNGLAATLNG